jgi:F-type H+-transporting ATPase subunit a
MADPVLHIKDSYYFEVPKVLFPYEYRSRRQFPDVWVSLDPAYQEWEAHRLYEALQVRDSGLPSQDKVQSDWHHYTHADHANFAKPLKVYLEEKYQAARKDFQAWKNAEIAKARAQKDGSEATKKKLTFGDYVADQETAHTADQQYLPFLRWRDRNGEAFERAKSDARDIQAWKNDANVAEWSKEKIAAYNGHLSGKVLIPQPFATLRNMYEAESGIAISKYLVIEIVVGLIIIVIFSQLAARMQRGGPPRGKIWNLLETFLLFIRDQIVRPSLGSHSHEEDSHPEHGHKAGDPYAEHGRSTPHHEHLPADVVTHVAAAHGHGEHGHEAHGNAAHGHHAGEHHADPAVRLLPLFWTIFFFVLGCNLMGMVPWAGAPTAAFGVTFALAAVTFATVVVMGMAQFGFVGFFLNQVPGMDLPWYMAIIIKPMILAIELLGLLIKHLVLSIRLLANMVAGHLVILGVMGLAFSAEAALHYASPSTPGWQWWLTATIAVVGAAAFNLLELFVAFLQAYIFTFLSALFIGAAIHKH